MLDSIYHMILPSICDIVMTVIYVHNGLLTLICGVISLHTMQCLVINCVFPIFSLNCQLKH